MKGRIIDRKVSIERGGGGKRGRERQKTEGGKGRDKDGGEAQGGVIVVLMVDGFE